MAKIQIFLNKVVFLKFAAIYYFDVLTNKICFVRILKGFKILAQGEVKRSPEIFDVNVKLGLKARQVINNKFMPHSLSKVYIHCVFFTKKGVPINNKCHYVYGGAALSGLVSNINSYAQGFVSLHPELLH